MKILILGASNSRRSINRAFAASAGARLNARFLPEAEILELDLNEYEMPIYSIDRQKANGVPAQARRFINEIAGADALIISYAEHNGGYTAAYKNLFDWASRIEAKVFQDKPMLALSASPGQNGAVSVLKSAVESAPFFGADIVASLSAPRFNQAFDDVDKRLVDRNLREKLDQALELLAARLRPKREPAPGDPLCAGGSDHRGLTR